MGGGNGFDWDEIKRSSPIVDTISKYVNLKKAGGGTWKGKCPFHNDGTPSFTVYERKENAHCFGCGWHGDVIDFMSEISGRDIAQVARDMGGTVSATPRTVRGSEPEPSREDAIESARARWERAIPIDGGTNEYLERKQIAPHGCRSEDSALLVPMYDSNGELQSVQRISGKDKYFHKGAPVKGARLMLGVHLGRTIVCEGFATGASIHDAVPEQVCVAFSKDGVKDIARELHGAGVAVVIAAEIKGGDEYAALAKELDVPIATPESGDDFNDQAKALGSESVATTFNRALASYAREKARKVEEKTKESLPIDLWSSHAPPTLPRNILPPIIERFARTGAEMMGVDVGGLAMSALTVCAAMITDDIQVKVKRHERWTESARIWTMLIGDPSYKKSPIMKSAATRVAQMDRELVHGYNRDLLKWKDLGEQGSPPVPTRLRIDDTTIESAQGVCQHSPDGILCIQDELSGWFGGIEKYSGGKGSAKDRSFWLRAFGGGQYAVDRVGRGSFVIDNLSVSILGGIQPDALRRVVADSTDDGLIQRFFPIVLQPSVLGKDEPSPDAQSEYDCMLERLHALRPLDSVLGVRPLTFSDGAQVIRNELEARHHRYTQAIEKVNKKLAAHIGKMDGLFPRLCIIWHCVEAVSEDVPLPDTITEDTARRVRTFLTDFLMRHSMAFYAGILGLADDHSQLQDVAGYILAHELENVTQRTLARGSRGMRKLTRDEGARVFEQLEAMGWLEQKHKRSDAPSWDVNPKVHEIYGEKAESERIRREEARLAILELINDNST